MSTTTITTTSRRLAELVRPVMPLADKGGTLPILTAVLLRGHGEHGITATATDRYRIGICRDENIAAPEGFSALVPVTSLRQMLTLFKATKDHDPELTLEFEQGGFTGSGVVHVGTASLAMFDIAGARITYRLQEGEFPGGLDRVLESAFVHAEERAMPVGLNVRFLADFAVAVRDGSPTMFYVGATKDRGQTGPVGVAIGDHFRGAIMPMRTAGPDKPAPAGLDSSWTALIAPPAKRPAELAKAGA